MSKCSNYFTSYCAHNISKLGSVRQINERDENWEATGYKQTTEDRRWVGLGGSAGIQKQVFA